MRLNTPAGLVDLRTGENRPHDQGAYCTKITAASPGGDCPRWDKFLREVTAGDAELSKFLQRVAGYAATGTTTEHALFFFYGTGGNGKGVFLNTLTALLRDYATVAPMEVFTESAADRHPTDSPTALSLPGSRGRNRARRVGDIGPGCAWHPLPGHVGHLRPI